MSSRCTSSPVGKIRIFDFSHFRLSLALWTFVKHEGALLYYCFSLFLLNLGPALPKALWGHSMLEIQGDIFLFGGYSSGSYNSAIYQLSCSSGICSWAQLNQGLKVARMYTVAIPVPDSFCLEAEVTTTPSCNQGWIGDAYCDDINNNVGCNFDGGDCCGANVNTEYCTECLCLEEWRSIYWYVCEHLIKQNLCLKIAHQLCFPRVFSFYEVITYVCHDCNIPMHECSCKSFAKIVPILKSHSQIARP